MWKTKWGKCIYTSSSGYKVYHNVLYRWLTLGSDALQTVINRRNPQKPILRYLPAFTLMARHYPKEACLLGLGGGGAAFMLTKLPSLIAVDNSEEVIEIARRFFMLDTLSNLTVIQDFAENYVQKTNAHYPHLMVDLYNAHHFPSECKNELFFEDCKKMMSTDGFLVVNLANIKEQLPIVELIKKQFSCTMVIPIRKTANMVIIASNDKNEFIKKIEATGELRRILWVNTWGYVGDFA